MINLDEYSGSCSDSSRKICVLKETKDLNVKAFNMLSNKNSDREAKTVTGKISCDCQCQVNSTTCKLNQKME